MGTLVAKEKETTLSSLGPSCCEARALGRGVTGPSPSSQPFRPGRPEFLSPWTMEFRHPEIPFEDSENAEKTLKSRLTASMATRRHLNCRPHQSRHHMTGGLRPSGASCGHSSVGKRQFEASDEEEQINNLLSPLPAVAWWWLRPAVPTGGGLVGYVIRDWLNRPIGKAWCVRGRCVSAWHVEAALCWRDPGRPHSLGRDERPSCAWDSRGNRQSMVSIWILRVGSFGFCCVVQLSSGC